MPKITESRPALTVRVEDADVYECGPDMNVFSWSPSPPGTANAKCTQVHLVVGSAAPRMLVRFKPLNQSLVCGNHAGVCLDVVDGMQHAIVVEFADQREAQARHALGLLP